MTENPKDDEFTYNPVKRINTAVLRTLDDRGIHPYLLALASFLLYLLASASFALFPLWIGGIFIIIGGGFSLLDRQLVLRKEMHDSINHYFKSIVDRYADIFIFVGLLFRYANTDNLLMVFITSLALTGTILVSYTGVRQEFTEHNVSLGFMERPERLAVLVIGALMNHMVTALYIIAIVANLDTLLRIRFIYKILKKERF
jgi:archaetidylinositol phosphate synthase